MQLWIGPLALTRAWIKKMEWNGNFGMEYGRYQNGMECKISRTEWKTTFPTSIPILCGPQQLTATN